MTNREILRQKQVLEDLFSQIGQLGGAGERIQSHWARYLCVLVSGFLETSIHAIYSQYAKAKAAPNVANYVQRRLRRFQNPKMGAILELTGAFSSHWESALKNWAEGDLKDAVDSIVANRNNIAHGRDVGITYTRIKDYYERAVKVIEFMDNQCNQ